MRREKITGTRAIGHRLAVGEIEFSATIAELAGVSAADADKMAAWMIRNKLTTRDFGTGRISVRHGGFLDKEVLGRIREEACK